MDINVIAKHKTHNVRIMGQYGSGTVSLFEIFTGCIYQNIMITILSIFSANHIIAIL